MHSYEQMERLAKRYRRIRYALPRGTRFYDYVQRPGHYDQKAQDVLRDWHDNPRIASLAHHTPITLN